MRYFVDAEFVEDGTTIMPISLALAAEDGRELYLEFEFDEARANVHDFVRENVLPHLREDRRRSREEARLLILAFVGDDPEPHFWGWYASYDWVLLCQVFGTMMELPPHFPYFIRDLMQVCEEQGVPRSELPRDPVNVHDALADARWIREAHAVATEYLRRA
jgi:hypothetical protein